MDGERNERAMKTMEKMAGDVATVAPFGTREMRRPFWKRHTWLPGAGIRLGRGRDQEWASHFKRLIYETDPLSVFDRNP